MQINFLTQPLDNNPPKNDFPEKADKAAQLKPEREKSLETEPLQEENLKNLKNSLGEHNITLKFRQDEETKQLVVELVNDKTGESIRQIPTEVSLKLSRMSVKLQGQFVDDKV
jgi:flagellar protein FlaG